MQLFQKALFSVVIGSNDFIDAYFAPEALRAKHMLMPPDIFVGTLISNFRLQLTVKTSLNSSYKELNMVFNQTNLHVVTVSRDFTI